MNAQVIQAIVSVGQKLYSKEMANYYEGNISVKKDGLFYITAGRVNKAELREEQICVLDDSGRQIFGAGAPSSELLMHQAVYEARGTDGAIIHAHAPCLTAYALCGLPVESQSTPEFFAHFGGCIRVAKYGRPGTLAIVEDALDILKVDDIVLLANHGVLSCGADVEGALNRLEAAEGIAKSLYMAKQIGREVPLPEEERIFFLNYYKNRQRG